jgi:ATP phosphoribosyltransferase regulatory subunit HisZ
VSRDLSSSGFLAETPDLALLERLREVLGHQPVTETELRRLIEQADGLVRTLGAHMAGSERRLTELTENPDSSLKEIARELHRVRGLRPRLEEARSLLADLETRARELRTSWLPRQSDKEQTLTRARVRYP